MQQTSATGEFDAHLPARSRSPSRVTHDAPPASEALCWFLLLTYGMVLANTVGFLGHLSFVSAKQATFAAAVWLSYGLIYSLPVVFVAGLGFMVLRVRSARRIAVRSRLPLSLTVMTLPVLVAAALQFFLFVDRFLFDMYGHHVDGFVMNLLLTPGGVESMGSSDSTVLTVVAVALGLFAAQIAAALAACWLAGRRGGRLRWRLTRRHLAKGAVLLLLLGAGERIVYGYSRLKAYSSITTTGQVFPFYQPLTYGRIAEGLGIDRVQRTEFRMHATDGVRTNYPLSPLRVREGAPRYNVVWLACESLRADMLTPEIMPATYAFAQKNAWFTNHISASNGTRMGMFGMFYGLYGSYWFPFLEERRGPVLMDHLIEQGYEIDLHTSAKFTYPEFDCTIWAEIPARQMHESPRPGVGWQLDRMNVSAMLKFIRGTEPDQPFMTFEFFESSHARYFFPPESVIREPYLEDFNYIATDLSEGAIEQVFNRYVNACHHLDSQIARVLEGLEAQGVMDQTIVVITGDHGEEFGERGRWGHNSNFVREQIHVPLVLHLPGQPAQRIDRRTCHLDIPATVLTALGVENPSSDYSLGYDLFGPERREYAVLADWYDVVYVDEESFATFPLSSLGVREKRICTQDGDPVPDEQAWMIEHQDRLLQMLRDLHRFSR